MDSVSHAAWGATIVRKTPLVWWAVLAGALPDIIPAVYGLIRYRRKYVRALEKLSMAAEINHRYMRIYHWTHSLIPISVVAAALLLVSPAWAMVTLPYYLHILLDIPTHHGVWATRLFYPFSDFHFAGGHDWWKNRWISLGNWAAIVIINVLLFVL